ncbi:hypothetical protein NHX12_029318 [Muraenolepis orangiensis]|uniref:Ubiquinol-cytochrome-c reductase complex assembly factor 3 n=1 Tax=Muraenolepis orangiensis TaxID=630683 RepID=A0A9Q0EFE2_9TELE|nr:hypothetical protein NHX12_029318 [Muraenolepis orangiensis]
MASTLRSLVLYVGGVVSLGSGLGLWFLLAPGEEKRKQMIKNLPEANPVRLEETRKRNTLIMQVLKEAAESDLNIARGFDRAEK